MKNQPRGLRGYLGVPGGLERTCLTAKKYTHIIQKVGSLVDNADNRFLITLQIASRAKRRRYENVENTAGKPLGIVEQLCKLTRLSWCLQKATRSLNQSFGQC